MPTLGKSYHPIVQAMKAQTLIPEHYVNESCSLVLAGMAFLPEPGILCMKLGGQKKTSFDSIVLIKML